MRKYIIVTDGGERTLLPAHVIPWMHGYLTRAVEDATDDQRLSALLAELMPQIGVRPDESLAQSCYRVLKTCHDHGVINYRGIQQEQ